MYASTKTFISLRIHEMVSRPVSRTLILCVCLVSNCLPVGSEKGCRGGEGELFAHVQCSRMDEDTDGISLWTFLLTWPLCVWRDTESSAGIDSHPIEGGQT